MNAGFVLLLLFASPGTSGEALSTTHVTFPTIIACRRAEAAIKASFDFSKRLKASACLNQGE